MMGPKRYKSWARGHRNAAKVFDPVEQQMYGAYQPQLGAIDREREVRRAYYDRLMKNLGGFAGALAPLLGGGQGAMNSLYGQGANTMSGGGTGFGALLDADQAANAAAGNMTLDAIDSPAELQGGEAGDVLAGVAGWIPSTMMKETGSAWGDRMANFPKEAGLQANLMMKDLLKQAQEEDTQFSGRIQDVIAGMAGDRVKLRQGAAADKAAAADARRQWYLKLAALELSRGNAKRADEYLRLANQREGRYAAKDKGLDPNGNLLPGFRRNPKTGVVEKIPSSGKGKTPDWGKIQKDMANDIDDLYDEVPNPNPLVGGVLKQPFTYKKAFGFLWSKYSGMVKNKARLRKLIEQILATNGFKKAPASAGPD
jgi:hypothetical protein